MATLLEPLQNKYKLYHVDGLPEWYQYVSVTPAHRFTEFVKIFNQSHLVSIGVRDHFDQTEATVYMKHMDAVIDRKPEVLTSTVSKSDFTGSEPTQFECMVILGPKYHRRYRWVNADLHARSSIVFPAFDCEFAGNETPALAKMLIEDFVCTIDWHREPSPRILMNSDNPKTETSTDGEFELVRLSTLLIEIDMLHGAGGGFIDVRNIWGEQCRITPVDERFDLRSDLRAAEHGLSKERLVELVRDFLVHGWGEKQSCVRENGC